MLLLGQEGTPSRFHGAPLFTPKPLLNYRDIRGSRAFFPLFYVKGDSVAVSETLKAVSIDCRMMNKHIRTAFLLNEAEAFLLIEPLNCSIGHSDTLLSNEYSQFRTSGATLDEWISPRKKPVLA
jgi:hypothetical protein